MNNQLEGTQISESNNSTFKPVLEINSIKHIDLSLKDIIKQDNLLKINGVDVVVRKEDGYFNLTKMCQAGGKEFRHWNENKSNQAFLTELSLSCGYPRDILIKKEKIFSTREIIYFGHPQVAINVGQWLSPKIEVQVTQWIFQLLLTGSVILGQELSNKQLDELYKEKISLLEFNKNQEIEDIVKNNRHTLSETIIDNYNCKRVFYIGYIGMINEKYVYKFGFSRKLRKRTTRHKNDYGHFDLLYCIECDDNDILESDFKNSKYIKERMFIDTFVVKDKTMKKTELVYLDDSFTLEHVKKLLKNLKKKLVSSNKLLLEKEKTRQLELQLQILTLQKKFNNDDEVFDNEENSEEEVKEKTEEELDDEEDSDDEYEEDEDEKPSPIIPQVTENYEIIPLTIFTRKELKRICSMLDVQYTVKNNNPQFIEKLTSHKAILNDNVKFYNVILDVYHERGKPTKNELTKIILLPDKTEENIEYINDHLDIFIIIELREICTKLGCDTVDKKTRAQLIEIIFKLCKNYNPEISELRQYEKPELKSICKDFGISNVSKDKYGHKLNKMNLIELILSMKKKVSETKYNRILNKYKNNQKEYILNLISKNNKTENDIKNISDNLNIFKFEELQNIGRILGSKHVAKDIKGAKLIKEDVENLIKTLI